MKKRVIIPIIFMLVLFLSGCKSPTTGKVASDVTVDDIVVTCDSACRQEKNDYLASINDLLTQAKVIISKTDNWKSITKKDLADITGLKDKVSGLKAPQDFETVHKYYTSAFNHYVEAVGYVAAANEKYSSSSDITDMALHNKILTDVLDQVQEAQKTLVYADEEVKFATNIIPDA